MVKSENIFWRDFDLLSDLVIFIEFNEEDISFDANNMQQPFGDRK